MKNDRTGIDLDGKSAIVTGGSRGIGSAIAFKLAQYGANIAIIDINYPEEARQLLENIKAAGRKGILLQSDVSVFKDAERMVDKVVNEFGNLDILINNAGINQDVVIWKMTEEQWDTVIDINLKGYFNYVHAVAPIFREQHSGKIVNISSINGLRGKFGQANYSASKAGIIGLTKTLAKELGKYSINVNAVAPGLIETDMMKQASEEVRKMAMEEIVLKRFGQPEEVADVVAFLCSELARHITGEVIKVDGGQYI
jgi:3-oxoacyl-[acyl-carrier protein] reductase